jgi:hypothetical protein
VDDQINESSLGKNTSSFSRRWLLLTTRSNRRPPCFVWRISSSNIACQWAEHLHERIIIWCVVDIHILQQAHQ